MQGTSTASPSTTAIAMIAHGSRAGELPTARPAQVRVSATGAVVRSHAV
ncbi:hypothetical protein [Nonomuraea sp. C10]|nr:hypothetical protein [Nonomuraea sp. C10]